MKHACFSFAICIIGLLIGQAGTAQLPVSSPFRYTIPAGYTLLDTASGDFNRDSYRDYIVILRNDTEKENPDTTRPLLILMGDREGSLNPYTQNDHVVLCAACGGVFGDPYEAITVKGAYFSVDHYGGSSWRWTRNITFKYDKVKKAFILHKDGGLSYHTSDPDKETRYTSQSAGYGKMPFEKYRYDAND